MLRSFPFLRKERKERIVLLGFISRQKLKKERKRMLRSLKERKRTERSEQPWVTSTYTVGWSDLAFFLDFTIC